MCSCGEKLHGRQMGTAMTVLRVAGDTEPAGCAEVTAEDGIRLGSTPTTLSIKRSDKPKRFRLEHGDIAVWGGPSRLFFHGVAPLADGEHALLGRQRINLTFRKAR